jgi:hypothetical protein
VVNRIYSAPPQVLSALAALSPSIATACGEEESVLSTATSFGSGTPATTSGIIPQGPGYKRRGIKRNVSADAAVGNESAGAMAMPVDRAVANTTLAAHSETTAILAATTAQYRNADDVASIGPVRKKTRGTV